MLWQHAYITSKGGTDNATKTQDTGSTQERKHKKTQQTQTTVIKTLDDLKKDFRKQVNHNIQNPYFIANIQRQMYDQMCTKCTFPKTERECWKLASLYTFSSLAHAYSLSLTHTPTVQTNTYWCLRERKKKKSTMTPIESIEALNGWHSSLPA